MSAHAINLEPWIGGEPSGWKRSRIRNVCALSPGFSAHPPRADEICTVVPMELLSESGSVDCGVQLPCSEIQDSLVIFEAGDVLFAKITPCMENGKGAFVQSLPTRYAFGSTEFHVLRPMPEAVGSFLYYCTFNPVFREYAAENMTGAAGQKRVSSRFLKDTHIFLPNRAEQERIAAYLDASCKVIDAAITAKQQQSKVLEDALQSGIRRAVTFGIAESRAFQNIDVDWIHTLPAHWRAVRIKRVLSRLDYGISESSQLEGRFRVLKMGDVAQRELRLTGLEYVDAVDSALLLDTDDIVYNRTNSPDQVGKAAIFRGSARDQITFASYLVRLRVNHQVLPEFLNFVLNSEGFLGFVRRLAIPSVQQSNLNSTRYGRMWIPLPPLAEQQEIVDHLLSLVRRTEQVKQVLKQQIDTLTAYRRSVIHECVTGQRRVTAADVARVSATAHTP